MAGGLSDLALTLPFLSRAGRRLCTVKRWGFLQFLVAGLV